MNEREVTKQNPEIQEATFSFATLRTANATRQREWDPGDQITLAYRGNEFAGEAGEVCNVVSLETRIA